VDARIAAAIRALSDTPSGMVQAARKGEGDE
jgi:hypothetical protein